MTRTCFSQNRVNVGLFSAVAESKGVSLYAPSDGFISFFNSPYYAHGNLTALDIYCGERVFGSPAPSPLEGVVKKIYRYPLPKSTYFPSPDEGNAIFVEARENPQTWAKILHIDPSVKEGDSVGVGESLGRCVREGFFAPWTDPHIHVELRSSSDPLRARGGHTLTHLTNHKGSPPYISTEGRGSIQGVVDAVAERYALITPKQCIARVGQFYGLPASVGGDLGILDGGVPHYKRGAMLGPDISGANAAPVSTGGEVIGYFSGKILQKFRFFECFSLEVTLNNIRCTGISCYLSLHSHPKVKVITRHGESSVEVGDEVEIHLKKKTAHIEA